MNALSSSGEACAGRLKGRLRKAIRRVTFTKQFNRDECFELLKWRMGESSSEHACAKQLRGRDALSSSGYACAGRLEETHAQGISIETNVGRSGDACAERFK